MNVLKIPIFLALNLLPYSSGFSLQNGRQSHRSQINMLSFLENIKSKTKFTLPSDTNIVYSFVLLSYSTILAGQPLLTNLILLQSKDGNGILSLNWVRKTSVILTIECSIYFYPGPL